MSDVVFFFGGWIPIGRVLIVGTLMYITLVVMLRISGSRTLATMNAFDFIVTLAIGATFGRALTARQVALAEAVTAFALLISLQYAVVWLQIRWPRVRSVVTNPPVLLYYRGQFLREAMRRQRITEAEVQTAARQETYGSMDEVEAIILETSGELTIISSVGNGSALSSQVQEQIRRRTAGDAEG